MSSFNAEAYRLHGKAMSTRLAERVREARGKESRRLFAIRVGVAERTIIRWEGGSSIELPQLERLAKATGKPVSYFCEEAAPPTVEFDEDPSELAEFFATPLGKECSEDEREHLRRYYRSDGPLRTLGVIQQVLQTYRGVRDSRQSRRRIEEQRRHRDESDELRRMESSGGEYNVIRRSPPRNAR